MSEKTLTRMDLAEAVHREVGLSRNDSAALVEAVLDEGGSKARSRVPVSLIARGSTARV